MCVVCDELDLPYAQRCEQETVPDPIRNTETYIQDVSTFTCPVCGFWCFDGLFTKDDYWNHKCGPK